VSEPLSEVPTGPGLGALLGSFWPADMGDEQLLDLLTAETRQLAYQQARQWAVMAELATRAPGNLPGAEAWTDQALFRAAVDEVRAELRLSRQSARWELERAVDVAAQPRVAAALRSGAIDRRRAIVIAETCAELTDEQAEKLVDAVLPGAADVTATGLRERVCRVAMALDPAWAERRYRDGLRGRRVIGYLTDDGTATITANGLSPADAAAACDRVAALGDRAKRGGAAAPIDHLRVEIFTACSTAASTA
jgi:hypothetical protein